MLMGGNLLVAGTKAGGIISDLQAKTKSLQAMSGKVTGFQRQQASIEQLRQKMVQARETVRVLQTEFNRTTNPTRAMKEQLADAKKNAGQLETQFQTQRQRLAELNSELLRSGLNTAKLTSEQQRLAAETDKVRAAQDRLNAAQRKYESLRGQLDWGNIKGDILTSAATIMAFKKPITVDMEFEQAMANVRSVANPSPQQFTALRDQALALGSSTQYTSTQAAQSQEVLMRAGLKAEEVLSVLPSVLQTAGAEGMEISQAADILINVTKNMNLPIEEMGRVADVMAYTSAHSNTNIAQLGEAALKAAGPFSAMGLSVEDLMATLGAMSNTVRGAEAGTALAGVTRRWGKNPQAVAKELARYGIKTMTKSGDFAPFAEIVAQVEQKASQMGTKQAAGLRANVYGMFGSQMQGFGRTLFNGEYSELLRGVTEDRDGASATMNAARNDTLKGDITSLGGVWEGLMIRIGAALDPINRFVTKTLTQGIQAINKWIDRFQPLIGIATQTVYALAGMMVVKRVAKYAKLAFDAFNAWRELRFAQHAAELLTAGTNTATLGANMSAAAGSASLFGGALNAALGYLPLIIAATITLCANWKEITEWAAKAGQAISTIDTGKISAAKSGTLSRSDEHYGVSVMSSTYMPPEIKNAKGGIYSRPIWTWAAEKGPEAIIPLTDKSRGIPLLMQAADILGITNNTALSSLSSLSSSSSSYAVKEAGNYVGGPLSIAGGSTYGNTVSQSIPITVNVNVQADTVDNQDLAARIARAVREALSDIMNLEERVSYA